MCPVEQTALPVWEHSLASSVGSLLGDPSHCSFMIQSTPFPIPQCGEAFIRKGRLLGPGPPVYWKVLGKTFYLKRHLREGASYSIFVMAESCGP